VFHSDIAVLIKVGVSWYCVLDIVSFKGGSLEGRGRFSGKPGVRRREMTYIPGRPQKHVVAPPFAETEFESHGQKNARKERFPSCDWYFVHDEAMTHGTDVRGQQSG
jgi:hypothetical protein